MRTLLFLSAVISTVTALADDKQDAANFLQLQKDLQKQLPKGWVVETSVDRVTPYLSPEALPTLVIRSEKPLVVELVFPSSPALPMSVPPENPNRRSIVVEIRLVVVPFVSPEEHLRIQKDNRQRLTERVQFASKHLKGLHTHDAKSLRLTQPGFLKPKTAEQKRRVVEYAFLWIRTMPQRLPTHHYKALSFHVVKPRYLTFTQKSDARNYQKITKALESILTQYEKATK